jgi:6-phosphofructokinase
MRGGTPVPADVELAAGFANKAVDLALAGRTGEMVGLAGKEIKSQPLADVIGVKKTIPADVLSEKLKLLAL